jgi:hypothetical protein
VRRAKLSATEDNNDINICILSNRKGKQSQKNILMKEVQML